MSLVMTWRASGPAYVALSLDFDLMAEGKTEDAAVEALRWTVRTAAEDDARQGRKLSSRGPVDPSRLLEVLKARRGDSVAAIRRVDLLPPSDEERAGRSFMALAGNMRNEGYLTVSLWDSVYQVELRRAISLQESLARHRDLVVALERALANLDLGPPRA